MLLYDSDTLFVGKKGDKNVLLCQFITDFGNGVNLRLRTSPFFA